MAKLSECSMREYLSNSYAGFQMGEQESVDQKTLGIAPSRGKSIRRTYKKKTWNEEKKTGRRGELMSLTYGPPEVRKRLNKENECTPAAIIG